MSTPAELAAEKSLEDWEGARAKYVDRRLAKGGAVLMGSGLLVWLAGASVSMVALVSGCRRYVAAREEPPSETVRRRLGQVRTSVGAGVGAWQGYGRP